MTDTLNQQKGEKYNHFHGQLFNFAARVWKHLVKLRNYIKHSFK